MGCTENIQNKTKYTCEISHPPLCLFVISRLPYLSNFYLMTFLFSLRFVLDVFPLKEIVNFIHTETAHTWWVHNENKEKINRWIVYMHCIALQCTALYIVCMHACMHVNVFMCVFIAFYVNILYLKATVQCQHQFNKREHLTMTTTTTTTIASGSNGRSRATVTTTNERVMSVSKPRNAQWNIIVLKKQKKISNSNNNNIHTRLNSELCDYYYCYDYNPFVDATL